MNTQTTETITQAEARKRALANILPHIREQERAFRKAAGDEQTPDPQNCLAIADELAAIIFEITPRKVRKARRESNSRPARWARAVEASKEHASALVDSLNELEEVRQEYIEWKSNLPENLEQSALGEKLETIEGIDVESAISEAESIVEVIEGAEQADLPRGFGRD